LDSGNLGDFEIKKATLPIAYSVDPEMADAISPRFIHFRSFIKGAIGDNVFPQNPALSSKRI
jgi:hypothetical protein